MHVDASTGPVGAAVATAGGVLVSVVMVLRSVPSFSGTLPERAHNVEQQAVKSTFSGICS